MQEVLLAYTHILGILIIFISLFVELLFIKPEIDKASVVKLAKADAWYGIGSIVMLATGLMRLFWVGKGSEYYLDHPLFILKLSLFAIVGILSIYPTVYFIKMNRKFKREDLLLEDFQLWKRFRKLVILELGILICIPFLANMIARGLGY